jgi:rSAM/selenodomain-associated transferase 1
MSGRDPGEGRGPSRPAHRVSPSVLAIVVKRPEPGAVKTRLAALVGPDAAADLARAFQEDLIHRFAAHPGWDLALSFAPADAEAYFRRFETLVPLRVAQTAGDLGARMRHAFEALFAAGYRKAALVGGDLPDLPARIVEDAFARLDAADLVLGPGTDGGYYLIGLTRSAPELFERVAWSTPRVLEQTLSRAARTGRTISLLEPWGDIDRPEDLRALADRLARDRARATFAVIERLRAAGLI